MSYNPLKDLSIYDDAYAKKPPSSYQGTETEDPKKNKKWPMKTPGLPQYVCVTYHTAKTLGYDQLFPKSENKLLLQHKNEFTQTNFINFYISMRDGFKDVMYEVDYYDYVTKTKKVEIDKKNYKIFYQKGLTPSPYKRSCTIKDSDETVYIPLLTYKPNLQVYGQDLRLLTRQKTRIDVTINRDSFISRGKIVAFSWHKVVIDVPKNVNEEGLEVNNYEVINGNNENIHSPRYPTLIEFAFRQLQIKDVLEGTVSDNPKDVGKNELAIAANYLLNLDKTHRIYDVLKRANEGDETSYQDKLRIKSDKDYYDKKIEKNGYRSYPPEFIQSNNYEEWSNIYKRYVIGHHTNPKSSGEIDRRDDLNELVTSSIKLEYINDGSIFPDELDKDFNKLIAINRMQTVAKKLNAALFVEPTIGVAIIGHTDCEADFDYNLGLSKKRATSIQTYLRELSKVDLGGIENLLKDAGRTKVLGAGMIDCVAWDDKRLRKKSNSELWENEECRKISFEFFIID